MQGLTFKIKKALRMLPRNRLPDRRIKREFIPYSYKVFGTNEDHNTYRRHRGLQTKKVWKGGRECVYSVKL